MELPRLLGFVDLIYRFQAVERRILRRGEERLENDVEHSYQLAMTAWYLNDADALGMDADLLIRYGLVHDLVEVHAGDTPAFAKDASILATKDAREAAARERIADELREFPELIEAMHAYERRDTREAKFVYALDKLLPTIANYLDGGRTWQREGVSFEMMRRYKADKIAESPELVPYFDELVSLFRAQPGLFPEP